VYRKNHIKHFESKERHDTICVLCDGGLHMQTRFIAFFFFKPNLLVRKILILAFWMTGYPSPDLTGHSFIVSKRLSGKIFKTAREENGV